MVMKSVATAKPAQSKHTSKRAGTAGLSPWLQGVACGVLLIVAAPTALLGAALLLPTLLAMLAENQPGRPVARAVLLFGLAGACAPFNLLWHGSHRLADAMLIAADIRVLAVAWSAQAAGWLLSQALPLLMAAFIEAKTRITIARLQKRREQLWEEWDAPD